MGEGEGEAGYVDAAPKEPSRWQVALANARTAAVAKMAAGTETVRMAAVTKARDIYKREASAWQQGRGEGAAVERPRTCLETCVSPCCPRGLPCAPRQPLASAPSSSRGLPSSHSLAPPVASGTYQQLDHGPGPLEQGEAVRGDPCAYGRPFILCVRE